MTFRKVLSLSMLALACLLPDAEAAGLTARYSQTTTLLPDGNILVTGGVIAAGTRTGEVQVYNMRTNDFDTWADPLDTPRSSHTATLMSDGRVLIAGGFNGSGTPLASIEACDPIAKTCTDLTPAVLSTPKGGHTANLLTTGLNAGRVLICGGQTSAAETDITGTCDVFNPADDTVSPGGSMVSPRVGHAAVLMHLGKVFVTGGRRRNEAGTAWIYEPMNEMYDPNSGLWTPRDALLQGRIDHSATVLNNGAVMIAGGYNGVNTIDRSAGRNEDEWTTADATYWGGDGTNQDLGSHGYLDGAELFNNDGRVVIDGETYGVAPYRTRRHASALLPDGTWKMVGGYGNIVRTVFTAAPQLSTDTVIYLNKVGNSSATIDASSEINFPLDITLARPVSGRLVDSDAYFSKPPRIIANENPSIVVENLKLYIDDSSATLDGYPVGMMALKDGSPGVFKDTVQLAAPEGTAVFDVASLTSDGSRAPLPTVVSSVLTFPTVNPKDPATGYSGAIVAQVALTLPNIYRGIKGLAIIKSGRVDDPAHVYSLTIGEGPSSDIDVFYPDSCDNSNGTCIFKTTVTFTAYGTISNLSPTTTIYSPLNAVNGAVTLELTLSYTADEVYTGGRQPSFVYGRSDLVIREMIFSTALGFIPKESAWKTLPNAFVSPALYKPTPIFDPTAVLTPAADMAVFGGRNCESDPVADCTAKVFTATNTVEVFAPVYRNSEGGEEWPHSKPLNSKRAYHTSTLLLTGEILTCGGTDGVKPLDTCELMDPSSKTWTTTGSMKLTRTKHTATMLPNGNVLVTGGATASSAAVTSAEIYYPPSKSWSLTTPMSQARYAHTATLLPDGNVLVAGGATVSTYSATSETFISSAAIWVNSGTMSVPRSQHTATLLTTGKVLVAGGVNGFGAAQESETYNYLTRTFTPGPDLNEARYAHTANLLRDGRVIVTGGSNNSLSLRDAEIYNGSAWVDTILTSTTTLDLSWNRANHQSVLLPNGKVIVTGGEYTGLTQSHAETFDPDFSGLHSSSWIDQGKTTSRSHHTSVLTSDNYIINIGGWDGTQYLDTTDIVYFSFSPDVLGLEAEFPRQPAISTGTMYFDRGESATLQSGTSNFHGITEASGGGAGPMNSSQSNPRVYMHQIANTSGFMIDLSTRIYSLYGGPNSSDWEKTLSSITVITPALAGEMPYGYYHLRVAANGQFSNGQLVQVSIPRPVGLLSIATATILGSTSMQWTWGNGGVAAADGFSVYAASNGVFLGTAAFAASASFTQTGLAPNTEISIKVAPYNLSGDGGLVQSATYYTLAAAPANLTVDYASFETVALSWSPMGNSAATIYELSISITDDFAAAYIPLPYSEHHTSTSTVLTTLTPDQTYYFRVRARNGAGIDSLYDINVPPHVSTKTVGNITNLAGTAISSASIRWDWAPSVGSQFYEVYNVSAGTSSAVFLASTTYNGYLQQGLTPNTSFTVSINARSGDSVGPSASVSAYTMAMQPLPGVPYALTSLTTGSFILNWIPNGNPVGTRYRVSRSINSDFSGEGSFVIKGTSITITALQPNTLYYIRIAALNEDGVATNPVELGSVYTLAQTPTNFRPVSVSMTDVTLAWDTGSNPETTVYELRGTTVTNRLTDDTQPGTVLTYLPFSAAKNADIFSINGLLTATTYYLDIAARNLAGVVTARMESIPPVFTVTGPNGAPTGSVGGTSNPAFDVTISGVMPDNRTMALALPAASFAGQTAVAVAPSATDPCHQNLGVTPLVEVAVYAEGGAQPQVPVTLTLNYTAAEAAKITPTISKLVMARYNPVSGECLPLETVVNPGARTITAKLNHFSVFQLVVKNAAADLSAVRIYPNPYYTNRGQGFVTLDNMPAGTEARIYTLSGEKVWEGTAGTTGLLTWDATNNSGVLVGSGVYLVVLDSDSGKKVVKIAVER